MTTHLYPGRQPSFRAKFSFKPKFHTHEWQRPSGGNPALPGVYDKSPESVHLRSKADAPVVRGSCSSSQSTRRTHSVRTASRRLKKSDNTEERLHSVASLEMRLSRINEQAQEAEAYAFAITHGDADIYTAAGIALHEMGMSNTGRSSDMISSLVQKWDKNGKNDVNKSEFRLGVKSSPPVGLGLQHDHNKVDELFDMLDKDNSGAVSADELRLKLEKMLFSAKRAFEKSEKSLEEAQSHRNAAARVQEVMEITKRYEDVLTKWKALHESVPVATQLGRQIVKKNIKINEIILKWDTKNGEISKAEFRHHVRDLGITSSDEEIDKFFDEYDADSGGTLDIAELKPLMKSLARTSKDSQQREQELEKNLNHRKRATIRAQGVLIADMGSAWEPSPASSPAGSPEASPHRSSEQPPDKSPGGSQQISRSASPQPGDMQPDQTAAPAEGDDVAAAVLGVS